MLLLASYLAERPPRGQVHDALFQFGPATKRVDNVINNRTVAARHREDRVLSWAKEGLEGGDSERLWGRICV